MDAAKSSSKNTGLLPRKKSLAEQTADNLRLSIRRGAWTNCLPPERTLSRMADVSRPVLRRALHRLCDEGVVEIVRGHPAQILSHPPGRKKTASVGKRVVLLCGTPAHAY